MTDPEFIWISTIALVASLPDGWLRIGAIAVCISATFLVALKHDQKPKLIPEQPTLSKPFPSPPPKRPTSQDEVERRERIGRIKVGAPTR